MQFVDKFKLICTRNNHAAEGQPLYNCSASEDEFWMGNATNGGNSWNSPPFQHAKW
jgi:hypothetical protein